MSSIRHIETLRRLHLFFGVGRLIISPSGTSVTYRVTKLSDLLGTIVPHFTQYPLLSTKWVTFTLWVRALQLIQSGAHITESGFLKLICIYAAMNRGPSQAVLDHFPAIVPVALSIYTKMFTTLHPWWVTGYCTLWASFTCGITSSYMKGIGYHKMQHHFLLSRKISEQIIMEALATFFNAKLWRGSGGWDLSVGLIDDLFRVSHHFEEYPLPSILHAEYLVWSQLINISYHRCWTT